ncbi:MAG: hypothetical protein ACT4QA_11045 [Panacagrimonas sp.]
MSDMLNRCGQLDDPALLGRALGSLWLLHYWDAELHRVQDELLLHEKPHDVVGAEVCFAKALEVSRAQQSKFFDLRAALGLARLWQSQNRSDEARALLRPVCEWFTEGFDTPDLREAAALREELG